MATPCPILRIDSHINPKTSDKTDYWDNDEWLIGVLEADLDSIESASECLDPKGLKLFRQFISKIKEKGWL
jgi:hypothetical protein